MRGLLVIVLALAVGTARADVGVTAELLGYSALFEECEVELKIDQASEPIKTVIVDYAIDIGDRGTVTCTLTAGADGLLDTQCGGDLDVNHQCEELTHIRLIAMDCLAAGETKIPCGEVSITGPKPDFFIFE